jgi:hypothetical protein
LNWSTAGIAARVTRADLGQYTVVLPNMMTVGVGAFGGAVQVTSVSGGPLPPYCYYIGSFISGPDVNLQVSCADLTTGEFEDAMFSLIYVQ